MEQAHRVGAASDTGDGVVGQSADGGHELLARLATYDGLEVAHHHGVRVWTDDAPYGVVGRLDVGDPVADRLVDGVLEGTAAAGDGPDLSAEQTHPEHVERLATDVLLAHVDDALLSEHGADGGGGDAVLSGAGLGDDAALAHPLREQALSERVVDLVRAGVGEVLALDVDARAAKLASQVLGVVERRGPADVVAGQVLQPGLELLVSLRGAVFGLELVDRAHERLGHELSSELAEAPSLVG